MTKQSEALRLADHLQEYWHECDPEWQAAAELRRLDEAHDWQYKMAGDRLRRIEKLERINAQLLEALELVMADVKTTPNAYEAQRQAIAAARREA